MKNENSNQSRRKFIQQSAIAGTTLMLAPAADLFANGKDQKFMGNNIKTRGYAARDNSGKLSLWEFERRPVGDNDILIETRFASICHSDIHQMKGDWGKQQYPQVPGHEIAGIVTQVGKNVTTFKVGDRAGVGCIVDSCMVCPSCKSGEEQFCEKGMVSTYGKPDKTSPSGITQGGYSTNIVVRDHFAIRIPDNIRLEDAAPLLCAGITTYSPLMRADIKKGDKVGVAGIGGLGHLAVKIAVSKGAEVYAFTTSADKIDDIKGFGAKEVIVVDDVAKLKPYKGMLDYMISTIPAQFDVAAYCAVVKPNGQFTQVGLPPKFELTLNNHALSATKVNYNTSNIGGIPETQEVLNYCAENKLVPQIQLIRAEQVNEAWQSVVDKKARYRYVINAATI